MTRKTIYFLITFSIFLSCQKQTEQKFYNEKFKWEIIIPKEFENMNFEESETLKKKGIETMSKNYDGEIEDNTKSIFDFKNGKFNYMESNYTPFNPLKDGDYTEMNKEVKKVFYKSFLTLPNISRVDTLSKKELIDDKVFDLFKAKIVFENKMEMNILMYCRLINNYDFAINLSYIDKEIGEKMINSVLTSEFKK